MPSLKDIQLKIVGVKKTQQITKAMNMVAAAKLRGAQTRMEEFRPYAGKFAAVMGELSGGANPSAFPLMAQREIKKSLLLVVTSDRGLCGSFNTNILNASEKYLLKEKEQGREPVLACIGKKGASYFKRSDYEILHQTVDCMGDVQMLTARQVGLDLIRMFLAEEIDQVKLVYGRFVNVAVQKPTFRPILPITPDGLSQGGDTQEAEDEGPKATYIYEPAPEEILNQLMPMFVNVQIMAAMLETVASEMAARMTSMDNATNACNDIIQELTLVYNKARQSAITSELMDIVGGAEALKG
jgi:F-type H+-transporting ATPase subunit gamma